MYGTWLPGDRRGWRERNHKKHVPGDYRDPPPPGFGDALHAYSKQVMTHEATRLNASQRGQVGQCLVDKFLERGIDLICLSVGAVHVHLLAKFPDARCVKLEAGHAKRLAARSFDCAEKLWSKGSAVKPITSRSHQQNTYTYITTHAQKNNWVWTFQG